MGRFVDLTDQICGNWHSIERDLSRKDGAYWLCECLCGNPEIKSIRGSRLNNGQSKSCGKCQQFEMIGQKFNHLLVLAVDTEYKKLNNIKNQHTYYKVQCDCEAHTIFSVCGTDLRSGHTQSCGCQRRLSASQIYNDLSGQIFGYLQVIFPTTKRRGRHIVWHCKCLLCGGECDVSGDNIVNGHTKSCGCLRSVGEANIQSILIKNNIIFEKEKAFNDLVNPKTKRKLHYDFYLPDYNRIIEFDGTQHQKSTGGWNTEEHLLYLQQLDKIKNDYALNNHISLVRIPYKEKNNITLELLLSNKYIVS